MIGTPEKFGSGSHVRRWWSEAITLSGGIAPRQLIGPSLQGSQPFTLAQRLLKGPLHAI